MNFIKKILFAIVLIFPFMIAGASASTYWADPNQFFDDTINGGVSQYISWYGSPTLSYVSPNILNINSSIGYASLSNLTSPINFVWVTRFKYYTTNNYGYFYWNLNSSGTTYDGFGCNTTGICSAISSGTILATASTAIPSTCFSNSSLPSTWCWAKVIRSGTGSTGTLYVAPDVNGSPGTFVQYVTSSGFDIGTTGRIAPGVGGTMQIGGNYPCVMHVSTDVTYNCFNNVDTSMQFNDDFWNGTPYNNGSVSNNTLTFGTNTTNTAVSFQPFGSTITTPGNFVWIERINSDNHVNDSENYLFGSNNPTNSRPNNALDLYIWANGVNSQRPALYYTGGSFPLLASASIAPAPPFYLKYVYNNPNLTVYYQNVSSGTTYSSLSWQTLIPSTNVSAYLGNASNFASSGLGSYFGWATYHGVFSIGGGNQYACPNYFSNNQNFDCFSYPTLGTANYNIFKRSQYH